MAIYEATRWGTFSPFYREHAEFVFAVALRIVGKPDVAEDVRQEAFVKAWACPEAFDPQRGSVRTWLRLVTRTAAIERVRHDTAAERRDHNEASDQPRLHHAFTAEERALKTICHDDVVRALERLDPIQRQAIELAYFHGLTYREVAQFTDNAEGTVKSRIRAGLKRLAQTV